MGSLTYDEFVAYTVDRQIDDAPLTPEDLARHALNVPMALGGEWHILRYATYRSGAKVVLARSRKTLMERWNDIVEDVCSLDEFTFLAVLRVEVLGPSASMREAHARRQRLSFAESFWVLLSTDASEYRRAFRSSPPGLSLCPKVSAEAFDAEVIDTRIAHQECDSCRFAWVPTEYHGRPADEWAADFYLARRHNHELLSRFRASGWLPKHTPEPSASPATSRARDATDAEASTVLRAAWLDAGPHKQGVCLGEGPIVSSARDWEHLQPLFFYVVLDDSTPATTEDFHVVLREANERNAAAFAEYEAGQAAKRLRHRDEFDAEERRLAEANARFLAAIIANTRDAP